MRTIAVAVAILCACVSGELLSATPVINLAEKNVEKTAEQVKGEEFEADKAEEDENDEEDEDDGMEEEKQAAQAWLAKQQARATAKGVQKQAEQPWQH